MAQVSFTHTTNAQVGQIISASHFGVNILFQNDEINSGAYYPQVIETIGAEFNRYPGGTVTEQYFDLSNPNATSNTSTIPNANGGYTNATGVLYCRGMLKTLSMIRLSACGPMTNYMVEVAAMFFWAGPAMIPCPAGQEEIRFIFATAAATIS